MNAPVAAAAQSGLPRLAASITDAQVRSYIEQGYLVVPGLVQPDEIEALKRDTVALARGAYPCATLKPVPDGLSDREVIESILCLHQPHYVSPVMAAFARHAAICATLSRIIAAHLPFWDGRVKCMQSMLFVKPPGFPGQAWHQDELYIPTRDRSLAGAWIAIDDATIDNGCLWVIPGSHRTGYLYPQREHGKLDEFDFAGESHGFDESAEVPVEVKAGTVVIFNGYLLHRSRRNRSQGFRRALVNHYMNAWSLLPWEGGAGAMDTRTIVPVVGEDPYAWKGVVTPTDGVWLRPRASAAQTADATPVAAAGTVDAGRAVIA
ncbi:MAG TPA: phytanoyl-CoA dioxygenase family protein [Planctomycetota bacterium]|nr:phytanoyl-CoA dioxygenase family protein [Planctomycetota bacterium]